MTELPRMGIVGVSGRMGQVLMSLVERSDRMVLGGVTEHSGHAWIGQGLAEVTASSTAGLAVSDDPRNAFADVDAIVDFSAPRATVANAEVASELQCVHVIGTTGLSESDLDRISRCARKTAIVRAGNMSLGVNLLVGLAEQVARALDSDFDIEVVEAHHRYKVDAPSGTALMLGEAAAAGRGVDLSDVEDRGRDGLTGARRRGAIGFSAIRGGTVVGEHDISFSGDGERLILRHVAYDREIYGNGALKAALWALGKPPGEYTMRDVLGISA
ncbi:MAG: 4-hydroxy-tetrahydrodipicolinate reductase [Rhodobacteraceae bacterium]|nr:4-hydroxy-tetrahydrodipicolinate reductase [Paracoccaceae bacterium]